MQSSSVLKFAFASLVSISLLACNIDPNLLNVSSRGTISISPNSGPVGTLVTMTSTDTDLTDLQGISFGGGISAIVFNKTTGSASALVMPGSATGNVTAITSSATITGDSFTVTSSVAPDTQQGSKLTGTGNVGTSRQGIAIAISKDGDTVLVGGYGDNTNVGAAWVFVRSGSSWVQEGAKLVGTGAVGSARQATSVALSADGNTALIGGTSDNSSVGAAWVFIRSSGTWTQQGSKLAGTGAVGASLQGYSVALSADGDTALVGGYGDDSNAGAIWVYTRSNGTWSQQGNKLVGTGATGAARQGTSVSLSANGNTALIGGNADDSSAGAAWVFTRSGSTWTQQGSKLVGTGATGAAAQGASVALSADGDTALVSGSADNTNAGAAWVYTRSSSVWTQQGSKLVGSGATGAARQGTSVSLSADGSTALVGGYTDNTNAGAAWVFTRSGTSWSQPGPALVGTGATGSARLGFAVSLSGDGNTAVVGGFGDNSNVGACWIYE